MMSVEISPQQAAAIAEADKRERHKSPNLKMKHWAAVHSSDRGWHVALVDDHAAFAAFAKERARAAFRRGDLDGFMAAATEGLMAKVRAELQ